MPVKFNVTSFFHETESVGPSSSTFVLVSHEKQAVVCVGQNVSHTTLFGPALGRLGLKKGVEPSAIVRGVIYLRGGRIHRVTHRGHQSEDVVAAIKQGISALTKVKEADLRVEEGW